MQTLGKRQELNRGVGGSFDLIRLAAATAVLVSHSFPVTTGTNNGEFIYAMSRGRTTLGELAVDVFFVTSGFLVTGSLFRSKTLLNFAWRRSVRILPALLAVVVLTTFLIGPVFTTSTPENYLTRGETYSYLLNAVFWFRPHLPGLFDSNPYPGAANGSLWTLFYEVICYVGVAATMFFRRLARPAIVVAFVLLSVGAALHRWPDRIEHLAVFGSYFFAGAALYVVKDRTPYSVVGFAVAAVICLLVPALGAVPVLSQLALAYTCVWLGFQRSFEPPGDYSYGIYLWAFPVQQMWMLTLHSSSWWENVALSLPVTAIIAYLSWTFIEANAMKSKDMIGRFQARSNPVTLAEADV